MNVLNQTLIIFLTLRYADFHSITVVTFQDISDYIMLLRNFVEYLLLIAYLCAIVMASTDVETSEGFQTDTIDEADDIESHPTEIKSGDASIEDLQESDTNKDKLNTNKNDGYNTNLHPVRLETIDVDSTDSEKSELSDTLKSQVNANITSLLNEDANRTQNGTSNQNNTSKNIPKRVKCLSLTEDLDVNSKKSVEININESESNENENKSNLDLNSINQAAAKVINGTTFLKLMSERHNPNITNRSTPGECSLVIFYASWCPFSAMAAPSFNGLARLYPDVRLYAIDSSKYQSINTQFGILALPTLILFHNTKPISKFNHSNYLLENFSEFINTFTGLEPVLPIELKDEDMEGPMPTKAVPEPDYYLYLAWIFTIVCALGYFGKSSYCEWIIESVRNNWREAEIQHEHID